MQIVAVKNYEELSYKAAGILAAQLVLKPASVLGLATGSSPEGTYRQLVEWYKKGKVDFSQATSINLDEYVGLTPSNDQSYRYFMQHHLFSQVNILPQNTHVPNGMEPDDAVECARYDALIETVGGIDVQLLGIGPNGHIGFNEPDTAFVKATHKVELAESTIRANARFFASIKEVPRFAYTMGVGAILQAKKVVIIASGSSKAQAVKNMVSGPITPEMPASILQLHRDVVLVADEEALSAMG